MAGDDPTRLPGGTRFDASGYGAGDGHAPHDSPTDAMKDVARQVSELRSYLSYFISAKLDGIIVSLRKLGVYSVLGLFALIGIGGMLVTAVVLLLIGLAGAVSAMFDASPWLGQLLMGALVLVLMIAGAWLGVWLIARSSRKKTVKKYERKRHDQRAEFGHDVHDRATGAVSTTTTTTTAPGSE